VALLLLVREFVDHSRSHRVGQNRPTYRGGLKTEDIRNEYSSRSKRAPSTFVEDAAVDSDIENESKEALEEAHNRRVGRSGLSWGSLP
jgi:hypothetical protein